MMNIIFWTISPYFYQIYNFPLGAVHKVRHAQAGRGSEKVRQFVTKGGVRACDVTLINFVIIHMKHEI